MDLLTQGPKFSHLCMCLIPSWKNFSSIEIQQACLVFPFIGRILNSHHTEHQSHPRNFWVLKKKKKTFDYIIHFLFIWRLGKVLFKMKRWRQKFKSVYCCHRGYILLILCLKSQWCFYTCNTRGSLVSLRWNVWLWNVRHLSGNRVVMCKMKCFSDISYITWNSLWNASRYSPSLYLESLKFLFLWRLEKETWNI